VLGIVILAAGMFVPRLTRSSESVSIENALRGAELARRQLQVYDPLTELLASRVDMQALKAIDLDAAVTKGQDQLKRLTKGFSADVRGVSARDQKTPLGATDLRPVPANAAGVRAAIGAFETAVRRNRTFLDEAKNAARDAQQQSSAVFGVAQADGLVRLAEASKLLTQAQHVRSELADAFEHAVEIASQAAEARSHARLFTVMDMGAITRGLKADLEDIRTRHDDAVSKNDALTQQVEERQSALEDIQEKTSALSDQLLTMREVGFTAGDDASFSRYRAKMLELSNQLDDLQQQEQLLSSGGYRDATFVDDDPIEGERVGGEAVSGLHELERDLAIQSDLAARYAAATQSIEHQIKLIEAIGTNADAAEKRATDRVAGSEKRLAEAAGRVVELNEQATALEDKAISAAKQALAAFAKTSRAVDAWASDARQLRQQFDTQNKNARLSTIINDRRAKEIATSSEGQAGVVLGRIYAERVVSLRGYLSAETRISSAGSSVSIDTDALLAALDEATDNATQALTKAGEKFTSLAGSQAAWTWTYQAALAGVDYVLATVDETNRAQHLSDATQQINDAVAGREQSPHLTTHVRFQETLAKRGN